MAISLLPTIWMPENNDRSSLGAISGDLRCGPPKSGAMTNNCATWWSRREMKTYPIWRNDGSLLAFEIENAYIAPRTAGRVLRRVPLLTNVRIRRLFSGATDDRVWFVYREVPFVMSEPYGDSTVYSIGPESTSTVIDAIELERAFAAHRLGLVREICGDLISFRLIALLAPKKLALLLGVGLLVWLMERAFW